MIKSFMIVLALMSGCKKDNSNNSESVDTQAELQDDRSWVTWSECSQKPGDHPCNFKLINQDGKEVELYDYYGKVILVDLSTMWCGVCQRIAPKSKELKELYGEDNFVWLTLLVEDESGLTPDQSDLQRWVSVYGSSPPVLSADRSIVDPTAESGYPVAGWPTVVIIDREMTIINGISGWSEEYAKSLIEPAL